MRFRPGEGPSRGLLRDCKTLRNLREPSLEALIITVSGVPLHPAVHMSHVVSALQCLLPDWFLSSASLHHHQPPPARLLCGDQEAGPGELDRYSGRTQDTPLDIWCVVED